MRAPARGRGRHAADARHRRERPRARRRGTRAARSSRTMKSARAVPVVRSAVRGGATGDFAELKTISQIAGDGRASPASTPRWATTTAPPRSPGRACRRPDTRRRGQRRARRTELQRHRAVDLRHLPRTSRRPGRRRDRSSRSRHGPVARTSTRGRIALRRAPGGRREHLEPPDFASQATDVAGTPAAGVGPNGRVVGRLGPVQRRHRASSRPPARRRAAAAFTEHRKLSGPSMNVLDTGRLRRARRRRHVRLGARRWARRVSPCTAAAPAPTAAVIPAVTENNPPPTRSSRSSTPTWASTTRATPSPRGRATRSTRCRRRRQGPLHLRGRAASTSPPRRSPRACRRTGIARRLPIGMAATATDRLSSPSIAWNFGDGGTATGGAVSHAFAARGAFTVTVTRARRRSATR